MNTRYEENHLIIEGRCQNNKKFRPSDWAERLSSNWAYFGSDHKLRYSDKVFPCIIDGVICLIVAKDLNQQDPEGYNFILQFAADNQLQVVEDRRRHSENVKIDRRENT